MPTLKEMIAAENAKRANKKPGLLSALQNAGQVIDQGLLGGRIGQIPQRATEMYQGLLNAPAELAALASPDMAQRVNRAMKNPAPIDRDKAMSTAMDFLQTSTPAGGVAGMFIGKGAKTWDAIKAQQAEELLGKGVDPREVWKQTGTLRGVDGALRQEIPDNAAVFIAKTRKGGATSDKVLSDAIKHDELYKAYPDMPNVKTGWSYGDPKYNGGGYHKLGEQRRFGWNEVDRAPYTELQPEAIGATVPNSDKTALLSNYLHEITHRVQNTEGFAPGGRPYLDDVDSLRKKTLQDEIGNIHRNGDIRGLLLGRDGYSGIPWTDDDRLVLQLQDELTALNAKSYDNYRRLAGEAEARLTQARMNMTMPERLQSYPPDMFDIPPDRQIVRGLLR